MENILRVFVGQHIIGLGTPIIVRVPDAQLNAFSDYVVQDMEQADQVITISVVTLLLILIVVILLLR